MGMVNVRVHMTSNDLLIINIASAEISGCRLLVQQCVLHAVMVQKPKRPYKTLTIDQKIELLNQIGKSYIILCEQYGMRKSITSDFKKQENKLIEVIGTQIRDMILRNIIQAKFFSVVADEVVDISNVEQLSICLRLILEDGVHDMFIDFVQLDRITGSAIAEAIVQRLTA